jgi:hypothetical protein
MPKKKTVKRRAWSKADERTFKAMAKSRIRASEIARKFKRTEGAIRQKALHLGVSLDSRSKKARKRRTAK